MPRILISVLLLLFVLRCNEPQRVALAEGRSPKHLPTTSMEPTIARGEYVFSQPLADARGIRRHDVVIYRLPADRTVEYVKRIVGLPGETVEIRNKTVYIGGHALSEPFARHRDGNVYQGTPEIPEPYRSRDNFGPIELSPDEVFVLGDNRDESFDSRYHGAVSIDLLVALVDKVGPPEGPLRDVPRS